MITARETAQKIFDTLAASEDGNPHYRQIDMDTLTLIFETGAKSVRNAIMAEREACAVIADNMEPGTHGGPYASDVATAIRSRP